MEIMLKNKYFVKNTECLNAKFKTFIKLKEEKSFI